VVFSPSKINDSRKYVCVRRLTAKEKFKKSMQRPLYIPQTINGVINAASPGATLATRTFNRHDNRRKVNFLA